MKSSSILSVNLSAVQANWKLLSDRCGANVDVGAVVKANAYGLGAREISRALYKVGCREFFVATKAEALEFKSYHLADATLYVLGGAYAGDEQLFVESGFVPVLFSIDAVRRWAEVCDSLSIAAPSVIKVDTGMTRLGLSVAELEWLCADQTLLSKVNPVLVMSHLACADEPSYPLNREQLISFNHCATIIKQILPAIKCSLANSSGIFLGHEWHFDLLRPGAALYGVNPTPDFDNPMTLVISLKLPVLQIRCVTEDSNVGYGAKTRVKKGARLAVAAGGYADGLHRTLGLVPEGYLNGYHVRAIGRISMDTTIFDISDVALPEQELNRSFIEVISQKLTVDYLMKRNGTIGYEVLTSLGGRYQRNYIGD